MILRKTGSKPDSSLSDAKRYEVGYKKPPAKYRFQPGRSGNPHGRPAKRPSPEQLLAKLMAGRVAVNENGLAKKITRIEALIHKMFGAAIKGDIRAAESIMKVLSKQSVKEAEEPTPLNLKILTDEELDWPFKLKKKWAEAEMNEEIEKVRRKYGVDLT